eukprot:2922135-Rhodomonas_salina.1
MMVNDYDALLRRYEPPHNALFGPCSSFRRERKRWSVVASTRSAPILICHVRIKIANPLSDAVCRTQIAADIASLSRSSHSACSHLRSLTMCECLREAAVCIGRVTRKGGERKMYIMSCRHLITQPNQRLSTLEYSTTLTISKSPARSATNARGCYAMSGTGITLCYAMSGTDITLCYAMSGTDTTLCSAMSRTDNAYGSGIRLWVDGAGLSPFLRRLMLFMASKSELTNRISDIQCGLCAIEREDVAADGTRRS